MMHDKPTIDRVARKLQLSERTLHRRLKETGTTYSALLDQCRLRLAKQLLGATDAKMYEIAEATGYRDPSSFSRAFFRWTGHTPKQYRKQQRASATRPEQNTEEVAGSFSQSHGTGGKSRSPSSSRSNRSGVSRRFQTASN